MAHPPLEHTDKPLATIVGQCNAAGGADKIAGPHFAVVNRLDNTGIRDQRPERFHHVQGQCRPAVSGLMIKTAVGIEAHRAQRHCPAAHQQRIGIRQQGVNRVGGRAAVARGEIETQTLRVVRLFNQPAECAEVFGGRRAFDAKQLLCIFRTMNVPGGVLEGVQQRFGFVFAPPIAPQKGAAIENLGFGKRFRQPQTSARIETGFVLRGSQLDVFMPGALRMADKPTAVAVPGNGNVALHQFLQRRW